MQHQRFQITIGDPHYGWLPLAISIAGELHEYQASNVLNDPLSELADVAAALAGQATVNESVWIWLEPASIHLQFEGFEAAGTIEVSFFDEDERSRFASVSVPRASALAELVAALEALEARVPRTGVIDGWGDAFPAASLRAAKGGQASAERRSGFLPPWRPIEDIDRIREEVLVELGNRHELSGVRFTLRAVNEKTDEYLLELHTGPHEFAVLAIDWNEKARRAMPVALFRTFDEWRAARMIPDSQAAEHE